MLEMVTNKSPDAALKTLISNKKGLHRDCPVKFAKSHLRATLTNAPRERSLDRFGIYRDKYKIIPQKRFALKTLLGFGIFETASPFAEPDMMPLFVAG